MESLNFVLTKDDQYKKFKTSKPCTWRFAARYYVRAFPENKFQRWQRSVFFRFIFFSKKVIWWDSIYSKLQYNDRTYVGLLLLQLTDPKSLIHTCVRLLLLEPKSTICTYVRLLLLFTPRQDVIYFAMWFCVDSHHDNDLMLRTDSWWKTTLQNAQVSIY